MVDDQILLPDGGKDVSTMIAHTFGVARHIGRKFKIGPVEPRQLRQFVHGEHAIDQQHLVVRGGKRPLHEGS